MAICAVDHVIFDLDGILLDTESLFSNCIQNLLKNYNETFTWDLNVKILGKSFASTSEIIVGELKLPITPDELVRLANEELRITIPAAKFMPGAEKLVRHLHNHKVPIGIVSGSCINGYQLKTKNHKDFFDLFHPVVTIGSDPEVKHGKPAPDGFLACAARFIEKPSSDKILVFEDAPNGVQSALAAGMNVIMVPDPRLDKSKIPHSVTVLKSLEEFKPEQFGLPMYNDV